jgi:putative phosphoesterase
MKIAVFSDIHSNLEALKGVLHDVEGQRCDAVYCLGDLVGYGANPNEIIELVEDENISIVMGNYDDGVGYERGDCGCAYTSSVEKENGQRSINWTTQVTTDVNKAFLKSLHPKIELDIDSYKVLLVHGSPRRMNEYLYEDRPEKSIRRILEPLDVDVVVCGHTHRPYHRVIGGVHVINDGSVGKPKDSEPRACYMILRLDEKVNPQIRRVNYNIEEAARKIIEAGLPSAFAEALRTG